MKNFPGLIHDKLIEKIRQIKRSINQDGGYVMKKTNVKWKNTVSKVNHDVKCSGNNVEVTFSSTNKDIANIMVKNINVVLNMCFVLFES